MESGLASPKADLEAELGDHFGYTADPDRWDADQLRHIDQAVKGGLSWFYFPDLDGRVYEWSFLRPAAELTLASGATSLDLPDDFNGFVDKTLSAATADGTAHNVQLGWGVRARNAAAPDQTGPPCLFEVEAVKGVTISEGTRYRLLCFPEADQAYTVRGQYSIAPDALSGTRKWVYGGAAHGQTVLWACLAAAEIQRDNLMPQQSPCWHTFQQRLRASVAQDRRNQPKTLGYNRDRSDGRAYGWYSAYGRRTGLRWIDTVTIDGQEPS